MPIVVLLDQDALLLPLLESEEHVLLLNARMDFSSFYIDHCPGGPQEWLPKNELNFEVAFCIHNHEIGKDEGVSHAD